MKKKQWNIPKSVLKGLADNIQKLIATNQGRIIVLEMIEEIPFEIRYLMFEGLSSFYSRQMVLFFQLLREEYGMEVKAICDRTLEKYSMAGLDVKEPSFFKGVFYKAYASCSRPAGRITIDIAWHNESGDLHVECFYLTYNSDGVHSFFLIPHMSNERYHMDRELLSNMVEITEAETAFLVTEAYNWNLKKMTRPAIGKFLYNKYLDFETKLNESEQRSLIQRLSGKLTPSQVVNSFYYAIKQKDFTYLTGIFNHISYQEVIDNECTDLLQLTTSILEGQAEEVFANQSYADVTSYAVIVHDSSCYKLSYRFSMIKNQGTWLIEGINLLEKELISPDSADNPFNMDVYCRVYEIVDLDELFEKLEEIDNISEVEELPYGLHMRVTSYSDELNYGVSFLSGVLADLIINGEEFVIICRDYTILVDLHNVLFASEGIPLISRGEYQVDLVTAFNYVGGSYINFEDVLIIDADNLAVENDLRFLSTIYWVKDRDKVLKGIKEIPNSTCIIDEEYTIFYQYEDKGADKVLLAEYILGVDWLTISTFGYQDMNIVRQSFEKQLCSYLELDGMEVREDGLFDILTAEMKRHNPGLEKLLKELYLNKWYNSRLHVLGGMSPSEASETDEGKQLLWGLIKKIHQSEMRNQRRGKRNTIKVKEYLNVLEEKKKDKR
ncbi:MAG TPA: hypothetical protein VFC73_06460 [Syntrophomonadaceae bacterium]|nr:hypothetical protein [Syntrophomonadaceae bacterium]